MLFELIWPKFILVVYSPHFNLPPPKCSPVPKSQPPNFQPHFTTTNHFHSPTNFNFGFLQEPLLIVLDSRCRFVGSYYSCLLCLRLNPFRVNQFDYLLQEARKFGLYFGCLGPGFLLVDFSPLK